jgi:hypothetical protein
MRILRSKMAFTNESVPARFERLCRNRKIDENVILNLFQDLINSTNYETLK